MLWSSSEKIRVAAIQIIFVVTSFSFKVVNQYIYSLVQKIRQNPNRCVCVCIYVHTRGCMCQCVYICLWIIFVYLQRDTHIDVRTCACVQSIYKAG